MPSLPEKPNVIRLIRGPGTSGAPPRVPFGLDAWSADPHAAALAIELAPPSGSVFLDQARQVLDLLPAPETMPPGQLVMVLGEASSAGGLVARLLGRRESVARAVRASALLARGYTRIGGARDPASAHDLVWGFTC